MKNRKLILRMKKRGWEHTLTNKSHIRFQYRTGDILFFSGTPSDWRAEKNFLAHAKRIESKCETTS